MNEPNGTKPKLLNIEQAAAYLAAIGAPVTINFIRTLITSGQVACLRMGKRYFVSPEALDEWIGSHQRRLGRR